MGNGSSSALDHSLVTVMPVARIHGKLKNKQDKN
jgi:hypothetical protein